MKTRSIIGKRITAVKQIQLQDNGMRHVSVLWIELEDGVRLIPLVSEGDANYHVDFVVNVTGKA